MDDQLARLSLPAEPGLLDGRAGIRLVQDTTARTTSPALAWDACLTAGISKTYSIDYDTAVHIVGEIGQAAIELEHWPDIDIRWDQLTVYLTTHTAGDVVTELDFLLLARIDAIAARYGAKPLLRTMPISASYVSDTCTASPAQCVRNETPRLGRPYSDQVWVSCQAVISSRPWPGPCRSRPGGGG